LFNDRTMEGSMKIEAKFAGTSTATENVTLFASVELGSTGWLVTSRASNQEKMQRTRVGANDWQGLTALLVRQQKARQAGRVVCGYEAGREGFWPYRALREAGIEACVLDPASIAVNQRGRRTKTDRTDGIVELEALEALDLGRRTAARPVVVPTEDQEDARQPGRTRGRLVKDRTALIAYIKSALARVGADLPAANQAGWLEQLAATRQWNGQPLPPNLVRDIELAHERLMLVCRQIDGMEADQRAALLSCDRSGKRRQLKSRQAAQAWQAQANPAERAVAGQAEQLYRLKAIGPVIALSLAGEVYWRDFENRRQVGGYLGLGGTEHSSGAQRRELGISKAGNRRARFVLVEAAWLWVEHQPDSALTHWFKQRAPKGASSRSRRIAIVALARKLAVALWRYLHDGIVPEGAHMKA
jgi:transposase